jgi:hypothetical protein
MTSPRDQLRIGDRVRERERVADDVATPASPNSAQVFSILRQRRRGEVVGFQVKRDRKGRAINYVLVQWDHLETPSIHAKSRIEHAESING